MQKQARFHTKLAGHTPRGPFKHYWGEHSRYTGDDNPYSLFLALGVPFEVSDKPADDGWTFLSDADAEFAMAKPTSAVSAILIVPESACPAASRELPPKGEMSCRCIAGAVLRIYGLSPGA